MKFENQGAQIKSQIGNHNSAIADYTKAIELNPADAEAYNNRGIEKKRSDEQWN